MKKLETIKKFDSDWNKEADEVYFDKAPLFPEFGRIVCMSFGMFTEDEKKHIMTLIEDDEEALLRRIHKIFVKTAQSKRFLCGFNAKTFDVPWITKKMYKYDIDLPNNLNFATLKPWEISFHDISDIWRGMGKTYPSLQEVVYELGLPSPKKNIGGEEINDLYWHKHDTDSIMKKCEQDVECLIQIAEKLKL
jgi:predicted PolB exonuclease-like 3'-5' exonuclease